MVKKVKSVLGTIAAAAIVIVFLLLLLGKFEGLFYQDKLAGLYVAGNYTNSAYEQLIECADENNLTIVTSENDFKAQLQFERSTTNAIADIICKDKNGNQFKATAVFTANRKIRTCSIELNNTSGGVLQ
jgi:hypothetical protein